MRLTTKGRYAVTAMLDLALHKEAFPVALADVSARQAISLAYLEQLFSRLKKAGLVTSTRGPGGGYQLALPLDQISVAQVVAAVDEEVDATNCGGQGGCQNGETCLTHYLWEDLTARIDEFLNEISLASLIKRREIALIGARQDQIEQRNLNVR